MWRNQLSSKNLQKAGLTNPTLSVRKVKCSVKALLTSVAEKHLFRPRAVVPDLSLVTASCLSLKQSPSNLDGSCVLGSDGIVVRAKVS